MCPECGCVNTHASNCSRSVMDVGSMRVAKARRPGKTEASPCTLCGRLTTAADSICPGCALVILKQQALAQLEQAQETEPPQVKSKYLRHRSKEV